VEPKMVTAEDRVIEKGYGGGTLDLGGSRTIPSFYRQMICLLTTDEYNSDCAVLWHGCDVVFMVE